jgi:hypothetical protein
MNAKSLPSKKTAARRQRPVSEVYEEVLEPKSKNFSLVLSESAHTELSLLAAQRNTTVRELIRLALGLARLVIETEKKGNKVIITNAAGAPLKQIVLP